MTDNLRTPVLPADDHVLSELHQEVERLKTVQKAIISESIPSAGYILLGLAILLVILILKGREIGFLFMWITASLYFYLFYPILPIVLFPFRYLSRKEGQIKSDPGIGSLLNWIKGLDILRNKYVLFRLFMRFFLVSLVPISTGIFIIYGTSLVCATILRSIDTIRDGTTGIIIIQCLGIIIFYLVVFMFGERTLTIRKRLAEKVPDTKGRYLSFMIIGVVLLCISTVLVIVMIIAMLMPAYTINSFFSMIPFVPNGNEVLILVLLCCQFILMQFFQSHMSRIVAGKLCDTLIRKLSAGSEDYSLDNNSDNLHVLVTESRLYAFNQRNMIGLYPSYSIGVDMNTLRSLDDLGELTPLFSFP